MNASTIRELGINVIAFVVVIGMCLAYLATQVYHWNPLAQLKTAQLQISNTDLILDGTGVFVSGVRVGRVRDVELHRQHAVVVLEYPGSQHIPVDSVVEIGLQSALGEPYINFTGGRYGGPSLPDGAAIAAEQIRAPESIPGIFEKLASLSTVFSAGPMSGVLRTVSQALDGTEPAIAEITDGTRLVAGLMLSRSDQLRTMFTNTQVYTGDLGWIVSTLSPFSQGLEQLITNYVGALRATENLVNGTDLHRSMTQVLHPFFERLNPYLEKIIPNAMDAVGPLMPIATAVNQTLPQIDVSELLARALEMFAGGDGMRLVITQPN